MKLAEALQERADLNSRIAQLRERLCFNALVQENEEPSENPESLITELDGCVKRLCELMERINVTNCETLVDGRSLTSLIAQRDTLKLKISVYKDLAGSASQGARRARMSEIKILSTVDVKAVQKQIDDMCRQLRETDNKIQSANWTTELK